LRSIGEVMLPASGYRLIIYINIAIVKLFLNN